MKVMAMRVYIIMTRQDKTCPVRAGNCFESFLATTPKQARVCEKKLDNKLELRQNIPDDDGDIKCIKCIKVHPLQLQQTQGLNL